MGNTLFSQFGLFLSLLFFFISGCSQYSKISKDDFIGEWKCHYSQGSPPIKASFNNDDTFVMSGVPASFFFEDEPDYSVITGKWQLNDYKKQNFLKITISYKSGEERFSHFDLLVSEYGGQFRLVKRRYDPSDIYFIKNTSTGDK